MYLIKAGDNMAEIRMEVVSESEALELCECNNWEFIKCYIGQGSNSGRLMMLAEHHGNRYCSPEEEEYYLGLEVEDTIIYTICNGSRMYLADTKKSGYKTTFDASMAKRFKNSTAIKKVVNMNKYNGYHWQAQKIVNY